ncbi:MAG: translation initiation factor IF-3 [Clostridium sp.]|nr:translation initiation factor IF-3 [Clostridium sp.]
MKIISKNKKFLINEEIREKEVRVVDNDNSKLGVMSTREAIKMAEDKDFDLVLMSPNAHPPVCRIMDFGKFIYEQNKKEKENKKNQKVVVIKEVRLSATIEEHDVAIKADRARKFLIDGDKVKVTVRFRGRENDYSFRGRKILSNFTTKIEDVCTVEKNAKLEGRNMTMVLAPKRA